MAIANSTWSSPTVEERFWKYVNKTETCWLWTGTTGGSNARYGYLRVHTRAHMGRTTAHRVAYELMVGPIPEGYEVDHVRALGCTSKLCVNPGHLEAVTSNENMRRMRRDVCRSGKHDLTKPENQRFDAQGRRRGCSACARDREAERAARRAKPTINPD